MSDNEIFSTAISIIAASSTGKGNIRLGGAPEYNARYSEYATQTLKLLRDYIEDDEIAFRALPTNKYADSARWFGANIRINERFRSSIPTVAVLLMHEGCHLSRNVHSLNLVEQEVICRTLGVCLYRDLKAGVDISAGNDNLRFSLPANDPPIELNIQNQKVQESRLIDWIIANGYADLLTAEWIAHSFSWWQGISHREPATKGHYIRALVKQRDRYARQILEILESMKTAGPNWQDEWNEMVDSATSQGPIQQALITAFDFLRYSHSYYARIQAIQRHFNINLGANPS